MIFPGAAAMMSTSPSDAQARAKPNSAMIVFEGDVAADRGEGCPSGIEGWFRRGVEDIAEPRYRQAGLMKILPDLGEPQHRRAHPSGQHIESNQLADREAAVDDELGAKKQDAGGDQLAHELHRLARHVAEAEHPEARSDVASELLLPAALHLRLDRHGFERFDAGHAFHQKGLVLGAARKLLVEPPPEQRRRSG